MSAAGPSFSLGTGDVHVWWIDLAQVSEVAAVLSPDERARAARLRQPGDRPRWIKARIAMRQILAGYVGVPPDVLRLATADHGKPELVDEPSLRFSLTHAVDRAALAVAWQREVGIDLELSDPPWPGCRDLPALMATACTTAEAAWIAALPEGERLEVFLKIWTLKEAYLKGIGAGLMVEPRTLEITFDEDGAATIQALPLKGEGSWESRRGPVFSLIPLPPSPVEPGEGEVLAKTPLPSPPTLTPTATHFVGTPPVRRERGSGDPTKGLACVPAPQFSNTSPCQVEPGKGDVDVKTRRRMGQHVAKSLPSPVEPGEGLGVRASANEPPTDPAMPLHWTLHILNPGPGWVAALAVAGTEPGVTVYRWPPDSGQSVG